jgi:hypothetical protein
MIVYFYRGAVSVGFFGNEQTSKGSKEFLDALDDTNQTMVDISTTVGESLRLSFVNHAVLCIWQLPCLYS